jgi:hypothetical protein
METVTIPAQVLNQILQYLGQRPYVEVANLIHQVQQAIAPQDKE